GGRPSAPRAGARPAAVLDRRQDPPRPHHASRRRLPANAARDGRTLRAATRIPRTPAVVALGAKPRLGRITRRGDGYLRMLLVMGARSVLQRASREHDALSRWALAVRE